MSNIKALFFDFDWTLFDHKTKELVPSAVESIKKVQEKGIKVFINSARSYYSLAGLGTFDVFNFDGHVVANGGAALLDNKVLYAHSFNKELLDKVTSILEEHKISYMFSSIHGCYIKTFDKEMVDSFYKVFWEPYAKDMSFYDGEPVLAIECFLKEDQDHIFEPLKGLVNFNRFYEGCNEISTVPFRKDEGIKAILKELNIAYDEAAAFGDDFNDIDMFNLVKYSVCMGNGKEEVKKYAYHVTTNIEDDGIKNALIYLGLL